MVTRPDLVGVEPGRLDNKVNRRNDAPRPHSPGDAKIKGGEAIKGFG